MPVKRKESKQKYLQNLAKDHKEIESIVFKNWNIETLYLENISWGFNTTAFYLKAKSGDYVVRTAKSSTTKRAHITKDIYLSKYLTSVVPTTQYIPTQTNKFCIAKTNRLFRVSKYIKGIPPFDMTLDIFKQAIEQLFLIHNVKLPQSKKIKLVKKGNCLLHGDLTPSNILVAYGKIVGILDLEMAFIGTVEYDIARTTVLCWFRMQNLTFKELALHAVSFYNKPTDLAKILHYSKATVKKHLNNIVANKTKYESLAKWQIDYNFAKHAFDTVTKIEHL